MTYQIKVECPRCERFYFKEWPNDPQGRSTSGTCARCFVAHEYKHKEGLSERLLVNQIKREFEDGIVWQGKEKFKEQFGPHDTAYYEVLVSQVRGERESSGGVR